MLQYLDVINVRNDTEAEVDTLNIKLCFDSLFFMGMFAYLITCLCMLDSVKGS